MWAQITCVCTHTYVDTVTHTCTHTHAHTHTHTQVGPHIVVFKTHVDIFDKWDQSIVDRLVALAKKHGE